MLNFIRDYLNFLKGLLIFIGKLLSSCLVISISSVSAFIIGGIAIQDPCGMPHCSHGPNDFGIGVALIFIVACPSLIWLCGSELYYRIKKCEQKTRALMLLFPSVYAFIIMEYF